MNREEQLAMLNRIMDRIRGIRPEDPTEEKVKTLVEVRAQLRQLAETMARHKLSEQVRQRRRAWGLTQEGLAGWADLTQEEIARIEAGHLNPTLRILVVLAEALGCDVVDLLE